jgi:hypothetical protein
MRSTCDRLLPPAWREVALVIVLVCATLAVYWPVSRHPFIFLDDQPYVVHNSAITHLNWETVKWAFTTYRAANWHPVTWLSHALDYRLFGLDAGRHHETNLLLHVLNAVVLFWVLSQATGRRGRSFAVAALFALHPVNVESVAWVAERKNLLSMLFFLLALGAYYAYARKPQIGRYLIVAGLYALGLMSKPQIITLPFVLLLWDYWPLGRIASRSSLFAFRRSPQANRSGEERTTNSDERSWGMLVLEKLPLLALSAASAIVTVRAQHAGGTMAGVVNSFSLASRLGNALVAYVRYIAAWLAACRFVSVVDCHYCLHACPSQSPVSCGGLVLVSGNADPDDWSGPGGQPGDGRSLRLSAVRGIVPGSMLGCDGLGRAMASGEGLAAGGHRGDLMFAGVGHAPPTELLV